MILNNMFVGIVTFIIIFILLLVFTFIESSFFHELGHLYAARKYHYCKARIHLRWAVPLFKVKDCVIYRDKTDKTRGRTDLANNYLPYSDEELKKIAKQGMKMGELSIELCGIILAMLFRGITYLFNVESLFATLGMVEILLCTLLLSLWPYWNYCTYNKGWSDKNIYENPEEFRKFMEISVSLLHNSVK